MPALPVRLVLYLLFALSGAAGLGYQIVWARAFALGLGHELPGVLAVVTAIFAGLSLGSFTLDRRISLSRRPGLWYAVLEAIIGLWALVTIVLIPVVDAVSADWIGLEPGRALRHWGVTFAVPLVVLLPATFAMGATLPAMERFAFALAPGRHVGGLYAANTLGAVAGTLAAAYGSLPWLGMRTSLAAFAGLNLLCGGLAFALSRTAIDRDAPGAEEREGGAGIDSDPEIGWRLEGTPAIRWLPLLWLGTGFLGIAYESLGVRVLSRIFENSIYSFAVILSFYLAGTAVGAAAYQRWARPRSVEPMLGRLLVALAATCALGGVALYLEVPIYRAARQGLGDSLPAVAASELFVTALVFLAPTVCMGATFSHLVQAARREDGGVGRAASVNTLGAALAPPLLGVVALPILGAPLLLGGIVAGYLLLAGRWLLVLLLLPLCLLRPVSLPRELHREGETLLAWREGTMASVAVIENAEGERRLRVNGRFQMGGTDAGLVETREALLPLMLHPDPRRAAFLGVASGATLEAALGHPGLAITGVELLPEILELLPYFDGRALDGDASSILESPRVSLIAADARRFVRTSPERFDVVVADLFHPGRDGAGTLYTAEHFAAVRERLAEGGLFCQWLPLYQLDEPTLQTIVGTFQTAFPDAWALLADFDLERAAVGLVGMRQGALEIPLERWRADPSRLPARSLLEENRLESAVALAGAALASPEQLRRYSAGAPIASDDLPLVVYEAPRFTARRDALPYESLLGWIDAVGTADIEALFGEETTDRTARIDRVDRARRFVQARDDYLRGLALAHRGDGRRSMEALWRSLEHSRDFSEVRHHLERIADAVESRFPSKARAIRQRLAARAQHALDDG